MILTQYEKSLNEGDAAALLTERAEITEQQRPEGTWRQSKHLNPHLQTGNSLLPQ